MIGWKRPSKIIKIKTDFRFFPRFWSPIQAKLIIDFQFFFNISIDLVLKNTHLVFEDSETIFRASKSDYDVAQNRILSLNAVFPVFWSPIQAKLIIDFQILLNAPIEGVQKNTHLVFGDNLAIFRVSKCDYNVAQKRILSLNARFSRFLITDLSQTNYQFPNITQYINKGSSEKQPPSFWRLWNNY